MLAHTFRGSTWRSLVGLESDRAVFKRYKARRALEREYVPESALVLDDRAHAPLDGRIVSIAISAVFDGVRSVLPLVPIELIASVAFSFSLIVPLISTRWPT
jgi:hypothetical protein